MIGSKIKNIIICLHYSIWLIIIIFFVEIKSTIEDIIAVLKEDTSMTVEEEKQKAIEIAKEQYKKLLEREKENKNTSDNK